MNGKSRFLLMGVAFVFALSTALYAQVPVVTTDDGSAAADNTSVSTVTTDPIAGDNAATNPDYARRA